MYEVHSSLITPRIPFQRAQMCKRIAPLKLGCQFGVLSMTMPPNFGETSSDMPYNGISLAIQRIK